MTKRTMLFVLMTVAGMVSMLTFSIYAWAIPTTDFPTSLWQDSLTGGQITVTSVIGNYNTSWNYVVSNVSYNPLGEGLEYFQLPPLPPGITVTGENAPSGWIMTQQNPPTWQTAPGSPTAGIPPGTQGVFSIQTSGSPGVKGETGLAGAPQVASFTGELLGPVQATASSSSRATLTLVSGTVFVTPVGSHTPSPAYVGELLYRGDVITTGSDGNATATGTSGDAFMLGPNGEVALGDDVIDPGHHHRRLLIYLAQLWALTLTATGGHEPGYWEGDTGTAVIGVRGTQVQGSVSPTSTEIYVVSDSAEVADLTTGFLTTITDVSAGTTFTLTTPVPEPTTMLLLGSGLLGLAGLWRKFKK